MPLVTVVLFFIFLGLLFVLSNVLKNRKKLKAVKVFGIKEFEIELPQEAYISPKTSGSAFPSFSNCSDAEGFFMLITPYVGSLSKNRREFIYQYINDLKNELKMNKGIYQYFTDEYQKYKGLSEKDAATKWAGK